MATAAEPGDRDAHSLAVHLAAAPLRVLGRVPEASNAVFVAECGAGNEAVRVAYKPAAGERPLWDFPGAVLARNEVAAYDIDRLLGFGCVPVTVWRDDAPLGPGAVQQWVDGNPTADIDVFPPPELPAEWLMVLRGEGPRGEEVVLAHRDSRRLEDIAVLDVVINNADRKAGHLLGDGGHIMAIDHGVAFHPQWKLRTVLWGFAGRPLSQRHSAALRRLHTAADQGSIGGLEEAACEAMNHRVVDLLATGVFPSPRPGWPVVPWPLW